MTIPLILQQTASSGEGVRLSRRRRQPCLACCRRRPTAAEARRGSNLSWTRWRLICWVEWSCPVAAQRLCRRLPPRASPDLKQPAPSESPCAAAQDHEPDVQCSRSLPIARTSAIRGRSVPRSGGFSRCAPIRGRIRDRSPGFMRCPAIWHIFWEWVVVLCNDRPRLACARREGVARGGSVGADVGARR